VVRWGGVVRGGQESDAQDILRMTEELRQAYTHRNLEKFVDFFADDTVCMPNDEQPVVGKAAWRAWLQEWWEESIVERMDLLTDEILVLGDWAFERHHETQVTAPRGGRETRTASFKGVWMLRRQDGSWKIARYIWNFDPVSDEPVQE
jgi:uncharacterized protein (TIGR02246 family)